MTVVDMAVLLRCSKQFVSELETGARGKVPGLLMAERIEAVTGIPRSEWDRIARVQHQRPRARVA